MRVSTKLLVVSGALAAISACKGKSSSIPDDLKSDLALASEQGMDLASSVNGPKGSQVVSSVERIKPATPTPRPSRRAPQPKPAPEPPREPVPQVAQATPAPAPIPQPQDVKITEQPVEQGPPAPRPVPATTTIPSNGGSSAGRSGGGISIGDILGAVIGGVVIRGGTVDGDHCDPRETRRRPPSSVGRVMPPIIRRTAGIFR